MSLVNSFLMAVVLVQPVSDKTALPLEKNSSPVVAEKKVVSKPAVIGSKNSFDSHVKSGVKWVLVDMGYSKKPKKLQTFRAYEGQKMVFKGLVSGAVGNIFQSRNSHPKKPHNHLGIYWVGLRSKHYVSRAYDVAMRNCLFYHNGHALHACQRSDIKRLGRPASHGCTRLSPTNAKRMYDWAGKDPVAIKIIR